MITMTITMTATAMHAAMMPHMASSDKPELLRAPESGGFTAVVDGVADVVGVVGAAENKNMK